MNPPASADAAGHHLNVSAPSRGEQPLVCAVKVLDVESGREVYSLPTEASYDLHFSSDGNRLVGNPLTVWDLRSGRAISSGSYRPRWWSLPRCRKKRLSSQDRADGPAGFLRFPVGPGSCPVAGQRVIVLIGSPEVSYFLAAT